MALDALEFAAQHTDKLICYGSTALQNPANLVDGKVRAAADALRAALAAPEPLRRADGALSGVFVAAPVAPAGDMPDAGWAIVPKRMTQEMRDVTDAEGWTWGDLLAAANAISEEEYDAIAAPVASAEPTDAQIDGRTAHIYEAGRPVSREYRIAIAREALALRSAAPVAHAFVPLPECDSPRICSTAKTCAGLFGTKQQCAAPMAPAEPERTGCQGGACLHASDCAVHNAPALPAGPCDCGVTMAPAQAQPASEPVAWLYRARPENMPYTGATTQASQTKDERNPYWELVGPLYTSPALPPNPSRLSGEPLPLRLVPSRSARPG